MDPVFRTARISSRVSEILYRTVTTSSFAMYSLRGRGKMSLQAFLRSNQEASCEANNKEGKACRRVLHFHCYHFNPSLDPLQGEAYLRDRQKLHLGGSDKDRTAQKTKLEPESAYVCIVVQVVVIVVKHALKVLL
jgi:hypothetical protein